MQAGEHQGRCALSNSGSSSTRFSRTETVSRKCRMKSMPRMEGKVRFEIVGSAMPIRCLYGRSLAESSEKVSSAVVTRTSVDPPTPLHCSERGSAETCSGSTPMRLTSAGCRTLRLAPVSTRSLTRSGELIPRAGIDMTQSTTGSPRSKRPRIKCRESALAERDEET